MLDAYKGPHTLAVSGKIGQRNLSWMTDEKDANAT
jgi:hypothetical protein